MPLSRHHDNATMHVDQVEYHAEYERALVDVKDDLRETEGPDLTENMKGEIREWFNKEK